MTLKTSFLFALNAGNHPLRISEEIRNANPGRFE